MERKRKQQTVFFKRKPIIIGHYSVVGPKEGKGPLRDYFSEIADDDFFEQPTYEKAERVMIEKALKGAVDNAKIRFDDVRLFLAGDLLNQIISSSYAARSIDIPYVGVFGACSTMAESLALGACLVDGEHFDTVACATSSHFSTAERQFRYPLELGNQRPPTSQWTVTGAGATILSCKGHGPRITCATFGKVTDYGISDVNNMGAAMAPAAMNTLLAHFYDTKTTPEDYDLILSGDLGKLGSEILIDLMEDHGYKLGLNYKDCGQIIFKRNQNVLMGGSGCGCSA
ncbi:MAG: stage V sporulation protein AD, partial [Clostridia bacterium]|nr:stage V sporulation protein AD [Clostridia bacterium]